MTNASASAAAAAAATAGPALVAAATAAASAPPHQLIPPLIHAISGAVGGSLALLLFYPLERARIELQKNLQVTKSSNKNSINNNKERSKRSLLEGVSYLENVDGTARGEGGEGDGGQRASTTEPIVTAIGDSWSMASSDNDSVAASDDFQDALSEIDENAVKTTMTMTTMTLSECIQKLRKERALYRGVTPIVTTLAISNFVFFYVNEFVKRLTFQREMNKLASRLLASILAGVCNVLLTNPLWVANLRIVTGESQSSQLIPEVLHVVRNKGAAYLWSGTGASLLLVSNPVIQFFLYDLFKGSPKGRIPPIQAFLMGAIAKAIATVLTYPLQVTQTILRMQQTPPRTASSDEIGDTKSNPPLPLHQQHHQQYKGMWDCFVKVYGHDGMAGLFTGMRAKLLQTVLTAAFTFLTYEQIATALFAAHVALKRNHQRHA